MRTTLLAASLLLCGAPIRSLSAQAEPPQMMTYQMVFLRKGPATGTLADAEAKAMQEEHLAGLIALNKRGVNLLFGPFLDGMDLRGVVVVDAPDEAAARALFADDPYVKGGWMVADAMPWYGPKGWFAPPEEPFTPESFVFGFLMRGPSTSQPPEEAARIQRGHLAYMDSLHQKGLLAAAGPFGGDSDRRGIVIYRVGSVGEAQALAAGDPAVKAGRLVLDAHPWMTFKGILK